VQSIFFALSDSQPGRDLPFFPGIERAGTGVLTDSGKRQVVWHQLKGDENMTLQDNISAKQENDLLASLYPYHFVKLTTLRKNGEAVPTTIWFAPDEQGHIYFVTQIGSGKMKRIRGNPQVQLVPADVRGTVLDEQLVVAGSARELREDEREYAIAMLTKKYGEEYTALMARTGSSTSPTRTYVEIVARTE
jgi:uncharacterized protein